MSRIIDQIKEHIPYDVFSDTEICNLFPGSSDSRFALIKRAIAANEIIHLRRGLYHLSKNYCRSSINKFVIAQKIYGPSYISFESALAYYGLIPEDVVTITSACLKRSNQFETPFGIFSYNSVPSSIFYVCVDRVQVENQVFFVATPWKAIVDYVYVNNLEWVGLKPLIESIRIEEGALFDLNKDDLDKLEFFYKSKRVKKFIESLKRDLMLGRS
ncbi:MAG: hypothetical protein ABH859_04935 [Pseudomonadota bacterium]